jgi:putative endonuclease
MFYVYFLRSLKNGDVYIGSCENVPIRFKRHNQGKVKSTKGYKPWKLLGYEGCQTRSEAVRKEKFYKTHQQREMLKIRFKD